MCECAGVYNSEDKMSSANTAVCEQCANPVRILTYTRKDGCVRVRITCTGKDCGFTEYMDKSKFDELLKETN